MDLKPGTYVLTEKGEYAAKCIKKAMRIVRVFPNFMRNFIINILLVFYYKV